MGDNSIFIVFSTIWSPVRLKILPQFQPSWQNRLFTLDIGSFKKYDSFSFYLSIAVLLVFLYLIAANKSVLLLYACAHKTSLKYFFQEKIAIEICCLKCLSAFNSVQFTMYYTVFFTRWCCRLLKQWSVPYLGIKYLTVHCYCWN